MNIYKQVGEYDCMLACLATAIQRPIEDTWPLDFRKQIENDKGSHGGVITEAFKLAGLRDDTDYWLVRIPRNIVDKFTLESLLQGRRAILQVPSLNYPSAGHFVYWAGETLYDPSNKQVYRWLNQCSPAYVWIFDESIRPVS